MGQQTDIEWTHHTWSPWWGCTKVSPGCANCYADSWATRWGYDAWGPRAPRRFFGDKHWNNPRRWDRDAAAAGERRRVFPSMCDPLEEREDLTDPLMRFCTLIEETPHLDWLLLTKRPENIDRLLPTYWFHQGGARFPRNLWMGTSIENQATADARIPHLLRCPAPVRFLSCEPLLGAVDLVLPAHNMGFINNIAWVIVGGESGTRSRQCHIEWIESIVKQCASAAVPCFVKQLGKHPTFFDDGDGAGGRIYELRVSRPDFPHDITDPKGGDLEEFPADLRVRQLPAVKVRKP